MQKLAKELGLVIPVSFFKDGNNAHIIDADGTDLGIYKKSRIPMDQVCNILAIYVSLYILTH